MSLSHAQVQIIATSGVFDAALRRVAAAINASVPALTKAAEAIARFQHSNEVAARRHQARLVTRSKQCRSW